MQLCIVLLSLHLVAEARVNYMKEHFTPDESKCLEQEKFLYEPNGKCYPLLSEGPCTNHNSGGEKDVAQWLVLDRQPSGRLRAICRPCPCCDRPLHIFMATDRKCHHRVRERLRFCPHNGTALQHNKFGEGECDCIRSPPHARILEDSNDVCYPLYHRGPCSTGETLLPYNLTDSSESVARCAPDPCAHKGEGFAQWKDGDGTCYKLGSQGPCDKQSKFSVDRTTMLPDCIQPTNALVNPKPFTRPPVALPHNG
ncbi:uncharacterized protein [Anabrus simplex]|uniref:uncharacterized protein n=1 Tax=Anabrus simplex TaxID=316456 RepID=UPI0035A2F00C